MAALEQRSPLGLEDRLARKLGDPLRELEPAGDARRSATSRTIPSLWASWALTRRPVRQSSWAIVAGSTARAAA